MLVEIQLCFEGEKMCQSSQRLFHKQRGGTDIFRNVVAELTDDRPAGTASFQTQ